MNEATLAQMQAHQGAAETGAQSLIDAISGRNQETQAGLAEALSGMGMGQALGVDQARAGESMALAEMLARGQKAQTTADFGLQQGAQQAIGDWLIQGLGTDRSRGTQDINRQITDVIAQLQRGLQDQIGQQELERLRATGVTGAFLRGLKEAR
jgi:hypothetical protein